MHNGDNDGGTRDIWTSQSAADMSMVIGSFDIKVNRCGFWQARSRTPSKLYNSVPIAIKCSCQFVVGIGSNVVDVGRFITVIGHAPKRIGVLIGNIAFGLQNEKV